MLAWQGMQRLRIAGGVSSLSLAAAGALAAAPEPTLGRKGQRRLEEISARPRCRKAGRKTRGCWPYPGACCTRATLGEELKTSSSQWLKTQSPAVAALAWQRGFGAFSVGPSDGDARWHSIDIQAEHHRTRALQEAYRVLQEAYRVLQEAYRVFFTKYGVEFDERYVWD